jgi:hypothetical protein
VGTGIDGATKPGSAPLGAEGEAKRGATKAVPPPKKKVGKKLPGSGIPARRSIRVLVWVRRVSQVGFFALFFWFLCATAFRGTFRRASISR